ncbi:hypothetical protein QQG91_02835 [Marivivens sp. LCG002]|uniref:hypothetical protein n=1 Tax=Marivivens sp. LCG002 TaxID=3051171 RepID=UPI0025567354|nr:hypothetical protein [Marivivens sp. LCG002]WIV51398.1 hypothetical protein QQG91_02835 [Marivivens sp. LCG002]
MEKINSALHLLSQFSFIDALSIVALVVAMIGATNLVLPAYLRIIRSFVETRNSVTTKSVDLEKLRTELNQSFEAKSYKNSSSLIDIRKNRKERAYDKTADEALRKLVDATIEERFQRQISNWSEALDRSHSTLQSEIERLRSRSTTNLSIGLAIAWISTIILLTALLLPPRTIGDNGWMSIAEAYFPRTALVVLLQVSSAFFLRLYAANEADLKQNKNELLNLDHKIASVYLALARNDTSVIEGFLIQTERNFILEKGQTTAGRGNDISIESIVDAIKANSKISS